MQVTLDTNCVVDLEESRPNATWVRALTDPRHVDQISLQVVAISASERQLRGNRSQNFGEFEARLARLGLGHAKIIPVMAYCDMCFVDRCLAVDEEMVKSEVEIHRILFPDVEFGYEDYRAKAGLTAAADAIDAKWLNRKCDVQGIWSHIYHGGGVFVTNDHNFHKATKKPRLVALGAGDIQTPQQAAERLTPRTTRDCTASSTLDLHGEVKNGVDTDAKPNWVDDTEYWTHLRFVCWGILLCPNCHASQ